MAHGPAAGPAGDRPAGVGLGSQLSHHEVALIKIGSGGLNGKLGEVLARRPRGDVASAKVGPGVLRTLAAVRAWNGMARDGPSKHV
jgi:hypothetical protein